MQKVNQILPYINLQSFKRSKFANFFLKLQPKRTV